jgi:SPX domain protein involved in polyphosphate accumulation
MDRNILSTRLPKKSTLNFDNSEEELINLEGHKNVFPHAVLQIRWEGDSPRWLEELNGSHLIERVNGFSMYTHAVAVLIPSEVHKLPYWVSPSPCPGQI